MNNRSDKSGFTLVEILVAVVIITAILSMVFGSYFAASRSTERYKTRIAFYQQARKALGMMARQIRCSYAPEFPNMTEENPLTVRTISVSRKTTPESEINYFNSNPGAPGGEILHFVTTNGFFSRHNPADGLFEVTYKFDKSRGILFVSKRRFFGTSKRVIEKRNWWPLVRNIECVELEFFDGQQWLHKWDFKDKGKPPCAVKIEISCEDDNHRQYHYGTTAYICCQDNQSRKTQTDTLVSVNK